MKKLVKSDEWRGKSEKTLLVTHHSPLATWGCL
jgi:hypothetical protein